MSAFYDQASLVVVPSGYKSGKIYAQKPLTTDGQLTFTRASTATRVNASGLIETVSSGVPRLDYQGSTCPKLLLEPQRTNSVTYSEQFDDVAWNKYQCSITSNNAISPDGTQNADKLILSGSTGTYTGLVYRVTSPLANSIYMKNDSIGSGKFIIQVDGVGSAKWNSDGTLSSVSGGTATNGESVGNGWFRFTYVVTSGTYINFGIENGTTGNSIYIWGAQVEVGAYATSYIPTTSAAVTRLADACYKTGISSLIGQTEGTIFIEGYVREGLPGILFWARKASGGLYGDFITIQTDSNRKPVLEIYLSGSNVCLIAGATALSVGFHKFAVAYANNDFAFYVDGVQIGTDNSGTPPACNELYLDQYIDGGVRESTKKQALVFKTRLTNAQLAELTTL